MNHSTRPNGFTLLEVMCAFSILALVTSFMTRIWAHSIEKAETAIDQRELREIADTVFGKLLYEEQEHNDGDSDTLDQAYGHWAQLPQAKRDRYAIYRYVLEKRLTSVSGAASESGDTESMFDADGTDGTSGSSSSGSTSTGSSSSTSGTAEGEEEAQGMELWRYTMRIFRTDDTEETALITLQTYRKPSESALAEAR